MQCFFFNHTSDPREHDHSHLRSVNQASVGIECDLLPTVFCPLNMKLRSFEMLEFDTLCHRPQTIATPWVPVHGTQDPRIKQRHRRGMPAMFRSSQFSYIYVCYRRIQAQSVNSSTTQGNLHRAGQPIPPLSHLYFSSAVFIIRP